MIEAPPERPVVLDTKWKRLESGKETLGVEDSDVYQMLAYGRTYGAARLVLLWGGKTGANFLPVPVSSVQCHAVPN